MDLAGNTTPDIFFFTVASGNTIPPTITLSSASHLTR